MSLFFVVSAVILLIFLIYRRVGLVPATLLCVFVLSFADRTGFYPLITGHYVVSLANFIVKYFMVFVSNALFGKIMEETRLAADFSGLTGRLFGDRYAPFGAMLATALLSYGGVSVFVIVFTVYPIFLEAFRKANLPRRLIPACIMSSSCTFPLSMLPGGAQLNNIIPPQYIGTTPMALFGISIAVSVLCILFICLYFEFEFRRALSRGEGFQADAQVLARMGTESKSEGASQWASALPLVLIIVLINVLHVELSQAALCASVLAMFLGRKNIKSPMATINSGLKNVGTVMLTTAASVGFGGAVLACSGAKAVLTWIAALPCSPVVSLGIAASFAGLLTGNGGGGCDIAMSLLSSQYLEMGVAPEVLHRVVAIATAAFSCLPHNGMLITIMDTCGFSAREAYFPIFISTVLCGFLCLTAVIVLV